jgi:hypothetical protein
MYLHRYATGRVAMDLRGYAGVLVVCLHVHVYAAVYLIMCLHGSAAILVVMCQHGYTTGSVIM